MSSTTVLWLATLAGVIHVLLGALQSGSFNGILARYSLPPIPSAVFPWLGLALGLGSGIVMGLQQGDTFSNAVAKAIGSMLTGALSAMHIETVRGALPANTPGASGALQVVAVQKVSVAPPAPPVVKRTRRTWRFLPALGLGCIAMVIACFPQQTPAQQEQAAEVLAACVSAHWGQPVLTIASACTSDVVPVAEDIIADIEAAVESTASASDGGVVAFPYASDPNISAKLVTAKMKIAHGAQ